MTTPRGTDSALEREIGALADLPRTALVERWQALYRTDPPKGLSRRLLILGIAYRMQAKRHGGLTATARRRLSLEGGGDAPPGRARTKATADLTSGTRLVREWNGATYIVDVVDGHFLWNGGRYRSLSAIARAITGARWSGPRFFRVTSEDGS